MRFLPLVFKNLLRKKTRSGLTVGSILLPFFVICLLGTFVAMLDADPSQGRGMYRLAVRHKVSIANVLPASHLAKIRELPGVSAATPFNWFGGRYVDFSSFNVFQRFAVDPEVFFDVFDASAVVAGSMADWKGDRSGLLVGELLMKKYGWRLGQQITLTGDIWPGTYTFTIRAVYRGTSEASVFFDQKVIDEALPARAGRYTMIWVKAVDAAATRDLIPRINALFENSPSPARAETEKEFQNNYIVRLDAKTGAVTYYQAPTPVSRNRRGSMDEQDRFWFAEYRGNKIGMFDTKQEKFSEWPLPTKFTQPYDVIWDKNGDLWTGGMTTDRVVRLDPKTGQGIEYPLARDTNMRHMFVDDATPVTFWVGSNHGASIVKVEPQD